MNKTYIIAGGAAVVSLAVGGAGGYLVAKKKFLIKLDALVAKEVGAAREYYSGVLAELKNDRDKEPAEEEPAVDEGDEEIITKAESATRVADEAVAALTNYQGFAKKPPLEEVVRNNIFSSTDKPKKALPPRDTSGKFLPKQETGPEKTPYLIDDETFLENEPEHDQESVLYFINDETPIIVADNEPVDVERLGEVNLTLFPTTEPSVIYVRNEALQIDYQITKTVASLTTYMGLGEDDEAFDMEDLPYEEDLSNADL